MAQEESSTTLSASEVTSPAGAPVEKKPVEEKKVGLFRLCAESVFEIFTFQVIIAVVLYILMDLLGILSDELVYSRGVALTTANIGSFLLSWQGILLVVVGVVTMAFAIAVDLFSLIYFCDGLLKGDQRGVFKRSFEAIKDGICAIPRFFTPGGIPILVYIAFLAPIVGVGYSVSFMKNFYIPSFIMEVVYKTPLYSALYYVLLGVLTILAIVHAFVLHGVLIDNLKPGESAARSRSILLDHYGTLIKSLLKMFGTLALFVIVCGLAFAGLYFLLIYLGKDLPTNYDFDLMALLESGEGVQPTDLDIKVIAYRTLCIFSMAAAFYLFSLITSLSTGFTMLVLTHLYDWTKKDTTQKALYPKRRVKNRLFLRTLETTGAAVILAVVSLVVALLYDQIIEREPVQIIVHRMGGVEAPENSLEGMEIAISVGDYGAETDIHRTADGYYVINHDNTFKRLTGVNKKPMQMTLAEVKQLKISDPNFPDKQLEVPTLEECIAASKDKIKLFIELKGGSADKQMVDDVVRIAREMDAVDDVALISLKYDIIDYAEKTYPEFETGLLFFGVFGDLSLINCDFLLMEEETATPNHVDAAHANGKKVGVWTVNTKESMKKFLDSNVDYIITDQVMMARDAQKELDERSDFEVLTDMVFDDE